MHAEPPDLCRTRLGGAGSHQRRRDDGPRRRRTGDAPRASLSQRRSRAAGHQPRRRRRLSAVGTRSRAGAADSPGLDRPHGGFDRTGGRASSSADCSAGNRPASRPGPEARSARRRRATLDDQGAAGRASLEHLSGSPEDRSRLGPAGDARGNLYRRERELRR